MAGNDDILLRIGADVADLKRGLQEARKEVKDTGGIIDDVKGKLLGFAGVFAAGLGITKLVGDALEFADAIQKAADQTGMTAEQVQFLRYAADQTGTSVDGLTSLVSKMQRQLVEASQGNVKITQALTDMGLVIGDLRAMSPDEQFKAIATAIAAIPDPAEQAAAATQAFGKAGADALPLIKTFAGEQERISAQFEAIGGPVSASAISAVDNLGDAGGTAALAIKSLATELLASVSPAIISGLEAVSHILGGIRVLIGEGGNQVVDLEGKIRSLENTIESLQHSRLPTAEKEKVLAAYRAELAELVKQQQILLQVGEFGSALAVKKHQEAAEELADIVIVDEAHLAAIERRRAAEESARNQREADRMAEQGRINQWFDDQVAKAEEAAQTQVDLEAPILDEGALYYAESWQDRAGSVADNLKDMTAGVAKENRAMFEINKAASLASAVVNTAQGVTKALSQYPPPLSFVMAAAQAAAGAAQISAISRSQFGSGTAPSQATTPATPVAPVGNNGGGGGTTSTLQVNGIAPEALFTGKVVRSLVGKINEHVRDGGTLEVGG